MGPYQPAVFVFLSMFLMLKHPDRLKHDLKGAIQKREPKVYGFGRYALSRGLTKRLFSADFIVLLRAKADLNVPCKIVNLHAKRYDLSTSKLLQYKSHLSSLSVSALKVQSYMEKTDKNEDFVLTNSKQDDLQNKNHM